MRPVLRQVADRQIGGLDHRAGIRLLLTGKDSEQGGLPRTVRSAETDPVAPGDLPRDVVEEDVLAEGFRQR